MQSALTERDGDEKKFPDTRIGAIDPGVYAGGYSDERKPRDCLHTGAVGECDGES